MFGYNKAKMGFSWPRGVITGEWVVLCQCGGELEHPRVVESVLCYWTECPAISIK